VPLHLEPAPALLFRVGRLPNPFTWRPPWSPLPELESIVREGNRWDAPDGSWNTLYLADAGLWRSRKPSPGRGHAKVLPSASSTRPTRSHLIPSMTSSSSMGATFRAPSSSRILRRTISEL
jgi:hypothetical protein